MTQITGALHSIYTSIT